MKVKVLSEVLEKNKSVQNLQKQLKYLKILSQIVPIKVWNQNVDVKQTKSVINLDIMKLSPIWKKKLSNLLIFYRGLQKT